jgi:hypothetical protein
MVKMHVAAVSVAVMVVVLAIGHYQPVAAGPVESSGYKVLKPIESGDLTLFPVVRVNSRTPPADQFLTLDEGLTSGEVEVTEAGRVRGLVRSRNEATPAYRGDQVNTLVLVNNSKRPLLLVAGQIVTGGKQDRVIAKDRIVPAGGDPIDLSVFCVEHGRWTESSEKFGATAKTSMESFMVQPAVRQEAMVAKDQQQVWNSVNGAISTMAMAAAAPARGGPVGRGSASSTVEMQPDSVAVHGDIMPPGLSAGSTLATTSYAKAMQTQAVSTKVDEAAAGLMQSREQALASLHQEHAVGVVVALHGEVIWADIFSDTELLTRYWMKLVPSYAAEGITAGKEHKTATIADAQQFLDGTSHGRETSEGEVGVYRYREVKSDGTDSFALESLLPGTGYDVHVSKLKIKDHGFVRTGSY